MSNQVVTIGYLKTFVNGVISVNTTKSDSYCPTYAELTGGTLVQNYSAGTNPTNYKPGIKIPSCTVGIGYTNDQLVIRQDLQLLWYVLQSVDVSASPTTISCCSGSSTLSTTAYFNLSTKKENATTTATTNTSTVVTASYSDDKSYTTINGSKITFSKNSVNYPSYTSAASRSTTVTSTYQYSGVTKTDTVTITQSANSVGSWTLISDTTTSISVSPSSMSFDSAGGSKSYSVTRYYTSYYERYDSCDTLIDTDTDSNSASVTPTGYNCTGGFTCTSSKVSCDTNTGSSRTGTLTVTWGGFSDTCSLSQGASQAGTSYGDPYNYDYYLYVTSPKTSVYCSGGTEQFTARYVTTWDYDWVTKDAAGNVTNSGTSSDSSSTDVTNSASWSTTRGSVSSRGLLTYGASTSNSKITYTVSATYNGYSDSSSVYQENCFIGEPCMTIYYTVSGLDSAVTVYFKTTNSTQQGSHTVNANGNQSLCNIAEDTVLVVSCSDSEVTVGGDTTFTFKSGTTASISLTKTTTPSTPTCNVPSGTFAGDYDFRVDFSEAVTSDITVYIDEKDGNCNVVNSFEVTVSKGKKTGYGNNVLVQDHTFVTAAYFEITDVKPNSDTTYYYWGNGCEYDDSNNCTETPDLCTCGVISISVNPSSYEFTSSTESKTFSVTIVDNDCTGCTGGFKVYNSSGTYVTSGTTSFTLSNQSGTFTIRANDDTRKTCTLTTTAYTAPELVYQYSFKNCYTDRQIGLFASNATPSGANTKYIMLNALDGTTATVLVTSNNGTIVNGSSSSAGGTAKIGDSVKLYSVTNETNIWTLEETITLTASDRSFEYGCSSTPTSCTCSVTSISVSPSTHTFTSNSSKSFSVTINDNDCSGCTSGWSIYKGSTFVKSGTSSSFSMSSESNGEYTIKSNDNTNKVGKFTLTKYTPPVQDDYEFYFTENDGETTWDRYDSFPSSGVTGTDPYFITSLKNGSEQSYSVSSNQTWLTYENSDSSYVIPIVAENTTSSERSGTLTLTQSGSNKKLYIKISQNAYSITKTSIKVQSVSVTTNGGASSSNYGGYVTVSLNKPIEHGELTVRVGFNYECDNDGNSYSETFSFNSTNKQTVIDGYFAQNCYYQDLCVNKPLTAFTFISSTDEFDKYYTFDSTTPTMTVDKNCSDVPTPTPCTCSVTSISVSPTAHTFTSDSSKSFSVTINDNDCSGCTNGFLVYNSSGTYVTSGTSSFSLSNQTGTFTIRAKDNTGKTCTLTTTAYTAPASTCVIGETITSNGGNGSKITVSKGGTKTLTIYTKEDGMFSMVSVVPDIYDSELVTISNTASSQTECHTTWVLTASNSKTGSTDITFRNGCGEYILPFEVTAATCQTSITYNSITATVGTVGKCSTSATFTVTANGTKTNTNCTTATTSTTLTSSNYTVKYGKTNGSYTLDSIETNETNSEVTWYYKITASSTYGSKTVTGSFKQEKGNCTPIYVFKFNNPTGGFDSTSTETHIIHKPSYEPVGPTTTLTSTKDGSNVGYTMSSNVNWITTSTASTTCSWTISKNTSTSSRSGTITLTQSGSNKTLTISVIQGGAPATKTCNPLFLSYDDTSHKMTATFDEMVSSDVTISFKVNVNNSAIITDSIKISEGNNSNTKTLSTSQSITSTAGTSISISSINPSSDSEYEYNCDTDWEIIPSEATCDCSTVSISCNPSNSYTNGDSVSTIVTVNAGSNCSTRWKAYSSSGSYLGEGESGKSLSRTTTGSVIFRSDACSGKTTTWSISKPECAKPTIRLSGSGDAYMLQSYSETDEWCGTNPHISVSTNADYIGDGSDYTHYSPTTCSFEIANCAASITSFNLDSGGWILDNYSGLNSFGIGFTIRPDAIVNGTCVLSGTFTYLMQGTPFSGTFTISIQFNG